MGGGFTRCSDKHFGLKILMPLWRRSWEENTDKTYTYHMSWVWEQGADKLTSARTHSLPDKMQTDTGCCFIGVIMDILKQTSIKLHVQCCILQTTSLHRSTKIGPKSSESVKYQCPFLPLFMMIVCLLLSFDMCFMRFSLIFFYDSNSWVLPRFEDIKEPAAGQGRQFKGERWD